MDTFSIWGAVEEEVQVGWRIGVKDQAVGRVFVEWGIVLPEG